MLCVGTYTYNCLSTICITTQERGNEEFFFMLNALVPMLCVGTHTYDCLSTICITTQERGNEEKK